MSNFFVYDFATGAERWKGKAEAAQEPPSGMGIVYVPDAAFAGNLADIDGVVLKTALWERVKALRDAVIDGGAPTPIGVVDSDELSRSNISGAALGALIAQSASASFSMEWTAKDNSVHTLDAPGMIALGLAVLQHVSAAHDRARDLRAEIEAASDVVTLLQIDTGAGWPS